MTDKQLERIKELGLSESAFTGDSYGNRVTELIRERYTISDELAILRQRDAKPEEFEAYNTYAEECKKRAKD